MLQVLNQDPWDFGAKRGAELMRAGGSLVSFEMAEGRALAVFEMDGRAYRASVRFDSSGDIDLLAGRCDGVNCTAACMHVVAAAEEAIARASSYIASKAIPAISVDNSLSHSLGELRGTSDAAGAKILESLNAIAANEAERRVAKKGVLHLSAKLTLRDNNAGRRERILSLRAGEATLERVDDLPGFAYALRSGTSYPFKRAGNTWCGVDSFAPESRSLALFIAHDLELPSYRDSRMWEVSLDGREIDRLIESLDGGLLEFDDKTDIAMHAPDRGRSNTTVRVLSDGELPRLRLRPALGGALLLSDYEFAVVTGRRSCYVVHGDALYACGDGTAALGDALEQLRSNGFSAAFSEHDATALLGLVNTALAGRLKISCDGPVSTLIPEPLSASVSFALADNAMIVARTEFRYGILVFDAFSPRDGETFRDIVSERACEEILLEYMDESLSYQGASTLPVEAAKRVYRLAADGIPELRKLARVTISEELGMLTVVDPESLELDLSVDPKVGEGLISVSIGLSDVEDDITWDDVDIGSFSALPSGRLLRRDSEAVRAFREVALGLGLSDSQIRDGRASIPLSKVMFLRRIAGKYDSVRIEDEDDAARALSALEQGRGSRRAIPVQMANTMRPYQQEGFDWLCSIDDAHLGCVLADEMGLGKTLQALALVRSLPQCLAIVICPSSLVFNWKAEAERFAPDLNVICVTGSPADRKTLIGTAAAPSLLVTSYDTLKRDIAQYGSITFDVAIIDEAQRIKNRRTATARCCKKLVARSRIALTGTPIENGLDELWSIFDFVMPGYLWDHRKFAELYSMPIIRDGDVDASVRLKELTAPFMMRRTKSEVAADLPSKIVQTVAVELGCSQRALYEEMLDDARKIAKLSKPGSNAILGMLTRLRQICCDPELLGEGMKEVGSAKRDACLELIQELIEGEHRVLLFSQFTSMLDLIEADLAESGIVTLRLDGSTPQEARIPLVNRFNNGEAQVFLSSLKAGGTGINLTGADSVIVYDPWWNAAAEDQAIDRVHRIGQTRVVHVIKLVASGTIEEGVCAMQDEKRSVAEDFAADSTNGIDALSTGEILQLLARG